MDVEIAQRLAELRRARGYSQETLARELGLSRQAVSKWERAESSPDTENLIALARLYGVSLDTLLAVDGEVVEDVAFEAQDRREDAEAAARAQADAADAVRQATEAAARASDAAASMAQMAATAASLPQGTPAPPAVVAAKTPKKKHGRWRSFPYWAVVLILFFALVFSGFNAAAALLLFLTIPIYNWVANILDEAMEDAKHAESEGE